MNKMSTLVFLVNKIKTEVKNSDVFGYSDHEYYPNDFQDDVSPPEIVVNAILNYARSLEVTKSQSVGEMEWVLN
jgi:hypothetical protein